MSMTGKGYELEMLVESTYLISQTTDSLSYTNVYLKVLREGSRRVFLPVLKWDLWKTNAPRTLQEMFF